jgi:hypothetical protein
MPVSKHSVGMAGTSPAMTVGGGMTALAVGA